MSETTAEHYLVQDYWAGEDDPELSTVHSSRIANVSRASDGIKSISRIVHNSLSEPDMSGAAPLGRGTELALLYALECLGDYIFDQMEDMRETAAMHAQFDREREVSHVEA
jgi:hypothetical protein